MTSTAVAPSTASGSVQHAGIDDEHPPVVLDADAGVTELRDPHGPQPSRLSTKHQRQDSPGSAERITGWPVLSKWAVACARGEESQQPTWPQVRHMRRCTQVVHPLRDAVLAHALHVRLGVLRRLAEVVAQVGDADPPTDVVGLVQHGSADVAGVEHRLLDVERAEHVLDHLVRDPAGASHVEHLLALGPEHLQPQPDVGLAGRLVVGVGAAQPLPRRGVALPGPPPDLLDGAERVVVVDVLLEPSEPGRGRLLEQRRPGQRVLPRVRRGQPEPAHQRTAASGPGANRVPAVTTSATSTSTSR